MCRSRVARCWCADRGAKARLTLTTLDAGGNPITAAPAVTSDLVQGSTAPNPIAVVNSTSTSGRHRTFTFQVPVENGDPILRYVLRREGGGPTHYYNVSCSAPPAVACGSTTPICYSSLSCQPGATVSLTVGLDVFPTDPAYLKPTQAYGWALIGARAQAAPRAAACSTTLRRRPSDPPLLPIYPLPRAHSSPSPLDPSGYRLNNSFGN